MPIPQVSGAIPLPSSQFHLSDFLREPLSKDLNLPRRLHGSRGSSPPRLAVQLHIRAWSFHWSKCTERGLSPSLLLPTQHKCRYVLIPNFKNWLPEKPPPICSHMVLLMALVATGVFLLLCLWWSHLKGGPSFQECPVANICWTLRIPKYGLRWEALAGYEVFAAPGITPLLCHLLPGAWYISESSRDWIKITGRNLK